MVESPLVIKDISQMKSYVKALPLGTSVGFVPTMGYLHQGHLSLVQKSLQECDVNIVSIFVNPLQFGENEDLESYPRDLERDLGLLQITNNPPPQSCFDRIHSVNQSLVVFYPEYSEIYPSGYKTFIEVDSLSNLYCGKSRPGHFRGVATIVAKLLNIVTPDFMYMGEKDFQQVFILNKMIEDLNLSVKIVSCPIVREPDGLAMSSRNIYLSTKDLSLIPYPLSPKERALCLYNSLLLAKEHYQKGNREVNYVKEQMVELITKSGGEIDYIAFINEKTFEEVIQIDDMTRILLAIKIGKTRLIDNMNVGN